MSLAHRSARRRGMIMGAAISSSRANKRAAAQANAPVQSAPAQPVVAPSNTNDTVEQIKKLAELRDQGILTEEEFSAKKAKLLGI